MQLRIVKLLGFGATLSVPVLSMPARAMNSNRLFAYLLVILAGHVPGALPAHHSAAEFDLSIDERAVTGIVKEFDVRNPHTRIVLEITDDEKGTREAEYEGDSRSNWFRAGWRPDLVKPGDEITLYCFPRKDGEDGGFCRSFGAAGMAIGLRGRP